jgi:hypothetical protein
MKMGEPDISGDTALSGTIIMAVGYEGGFLVCADKRSHDDVRGELDNDVKIALLDKFSGFTTVWHPNFSEKGRSSSDV